MAGRGPAPKHNSVRARSNKADVKTLRAVETTQPELPDSIPWPDVTREWWQMWGEAPQSDEFGPTDWAFLMETALLHANVWGNGDMSSLGELRIRVAKFGATPEDRARLKMQYAQAEVAEDNASQRRERRQKRTAKNTGDPREALRAVN